MSPKYAKDQPAGFVNRIEKVAIVGAGGTLGSYVVRELLRAGKHTITALTRPNSTSKLPEGVKSAHVDYDNQASLAKALEGQQVLVITLSVRAPPDTEVKLIRAAAEAGVQYIMPNAHGPDALNPLMLEVGLGHALAAARDEAERLGVSKWIVQSTGFWFEFSLGGGTERFGFDVRGREVVFFDDGAARVNTSTWAQCGRGIAALLGSRLCPEDAGDEEPAIDSWANGVFYVSSFLVSQRDMFESVKRVTGTSDSDWKISHQDSKERFREGQEAMRRGDLKGFSRQMYVRVFYPGDGDYEHSKGLANEALGLPEEDLDEAVKEAVRMGVNGELDY